MKLLKRFSLLILLVVAISSCNFNNAFIQKRKYQKGYHLSIKKKISKTDNSRRKDTPLEQKDALEKESSFSKSSEKNTGTIIKTENIKSGDELTNLNETIKEDIVEQAIANKSSKEKVNHIKTYAKNLAEQIKNVIENKSIVKSNTAGKTSTSDNSELINIILIVILVLLILALIGKILPGLGWLLGVVILVLLIYLVLTLLDVV